MEEKFSTKNWLIGIAISSFIATFIMGYLHEAGILEEKINPLVHTLRDWTIVLIVIIPITYLIAKNKRSTLVEK